MSLPTPVVGMARPTSGPLVDRFGRVHTYLRISVTDRCNYRCVYCMPAEGLSWLPRASLLTYEEVGRLVGVFARMGVRRVRLTGGEPTVRRDLVALVAELAPRVDEVSLTTNGHLFARHAEELAEAGLKRVNISLDTLDPEVFRRVTRGGDVARVLQSVDAALEAGLLPVKLNAVVIRGVTDTGVLDLVERYRGLAGKVVLRFIEHMPFSSLFTAQGERDHVPAAELRARIAERYRLEPLPPVRDGGPATRWILTESGLELGFISPITEHFCHACNRLRLTADGELRTCLSRDDTPSLRDLVRRGASDDDLMAAIREMVWGKVAGHEAHLGGLFEGVMTQIGG